MHFSAFQGFRFEIFSTLDWMLQHKNLWSLISHPAFCSFSWVLDGSKAYIEVQSLPHLHVTVKLRLKKMHLNQGNQRKLEYGTKKKFIHTQPSRWSSFFPLMSIYSLNRSQGGGVKGASRKGANRRYKHVTVLQDCAECRFCC